MRWRQREKENGLIIAVSLVIVFSIAAILYFQPLFFSHWIIEIENSTYDRQVRSFHKPLSKQPPISIVDIDDKSLANEGKWPWDRSKIARLASELHRLGASVIAFDMVFSEPQPNPVDLVLPAVKDPALAAELESLREPLDMDSVLAASLQKGTYVLGFDLTSKSHEQGLLPKPLLSLSDASAKKTTILEMSGYIGEQPLFQSAAKYGGFINTTVDDDGILRFSPLLMRVGENVFPSLALQAVQLFLSFSFNGIMTTESRGHQIIQAIKLGSITIPTDPWGRILIPFRGPPYSFPYLSATDVLQGKVAEEEVRGKLIFVGTTATSASDLLATSISPVFPGVEIQATIASGIIDHYLPHKPHWGRGATVGVVLVLGGIAAFTFPLISRIAAFIFSFIVLLAFHGLNYWIWKQKGLVLSFFFPVPTLATLFILDLIAAYIYDRRKKRKDKG